MKKTLLLLISFCFALTAYAQNKFEKGYFIENNGTKIECLIKNDDWLSNPSSFLYKLNENAQVETGNLAGVKEFSVGKSQKYQRYSVAIDRSSNRLQEISRQRTPEFKTETLFLRVLVEGNRATLYSYYDNDLRRYFFSTSNKEVNQLVFKKYQTTNGRVTENELYKKQLSDQLPCATSKNKPSYNKSSLVKYFVSYNNCEGDKNTLVNYTLNETKGKLRLKLKAGATYNKVTVTPLTNPFGTTDSESDYEINPRFGLELEYLLPFNNNRWSFIIEPSYQSFTAEAIGPTGGVLANPDFLVDYTSIEIPVGVRFYFPVKNNSDFFLNGGLTIDVPINDSKVGGIDITSDSNIFFGFGYEYQKTFSLEIRYNSGRNLLTNNQVIESNYSGFLINLGYTFLKGN